MAEIVLTTLNAKFIHAAFGLRCLLTNLGELKPRACLAEFDINQRPLDIAEALLAHNPKIIGFGIYIWNTGPASEVIAAIKRIRPTIFTPTTTSRIASFTSRRRAAARSPASFASRRSTSPSGRRRWTNSSARCKNFWIAA